MHFLTRSAFFILLFCLPFLKSAAQPADTAELDALYERLYLLPQNQSDSIAYYAGNILAFAQKKIGRAHV